MSKAVETLPNPEREGQSWPLTVAAYRTLGEAGLLPKDSELLYGVIYRKMSKSPYHSALLRRLKTLLSKALPSGFLLDSEQPLTCVDSEPEPDIAVIRGSEQDFWDEHPRTAELVIEICVTSYEYDRSKLRAYATAEVKECWFVLGPEKQIEIYRHPNHRVYAEQSVLGPGGTISSTAVPGLKLSLDDLFTR